MLPPISLHVCFIIAHTHVIQICLGISDWLINERSWLRDAKIQEVCCFCFVFLTLPQAWALSVSTQRSCSREWLRQQTFNQFRRLLLASTSPGNWRRQRPSYQQCRVAGRKRRNGAGGASSDPFACSLRKRSPTLSERCRDQGRINP